MSNPTTITLSLWSDEIRNAIHCQHARLLWQNVRELRGRDNDNAAELSIAIPLVEQPDVGSRAYVKDVVHTFATPNGTLVAKLVYRYLRLNHQQKRAFRELSKACIRICGEHKNWNVDVLERLLSTRNSSLAKHLNEVFEESRRQLVGRIFK